MLMTKLLLLAAGGAAGTLARFGVSAAVGKWTNGHPMAFGTLAVNTIGCLFFGLVFAWIESRVDGKPSMAHGEFILLLGGFMGAFTTFSTFAFDTAVLARDHSTAHALGNIALHNGVGIAMVFVGLMAGKAMFVGAG